MSLWKIAWRSVQQRGLASLLTCMSMALGVMMVVVVLSIHGLVSESFRNNANLGYNMIVGAKGGKLQLTLNSVYYLSTPIENIPYGYYLEFFTEQRRNEQLEHSIQQQARVAFWQTAQLDSLSSATGSAPGVGLGGQLLSLAALEEASAPRWDYSGFFSNPVAPLEVNRDGKYGQFTHLAIPLCLGDYFGRFRVVGTTPDMFDQLTFGVDGSRRYEFAQGRNFQSDSAEHGFFEAVVGATVAREKDISPGFQFSPTHGDPEGHGHDRKFTVVGVLKPTGTPQDRAVFVNIEGFYLMEDHAKPVEDEEQYDEEESETPESEAPEAEGHESEADREAAEADSDAKTDLEPLPVEQREVTAILIRTISPLVTPGLQNAINEGRESQAVLPILEIFNLFDAIVRPIQGVLLVLTGMICVVSGVSILVSIYNSMSDRRHEIAVMRALGAGRGTVMTIILLEAILLSLAGGAIGWFCGHALNWLASPWVESQTGVALGFWDLAPSVNLMSLLGQEPTISWLAVSSELLLIPALLGLAVVVGFLPALSAYRTDVAKSLGT